MLNLPLVLPFQIIGEPPRWTSIRRWMSHWMSQAVVLQCNSFNCHSLAKLWMKSSNGTFSALLAICAGNSPVTGEVPAQRPVTRSFDVFFYLRLNKRLSKQWWDWWFETSSRPLWRHCNDNPTNGHQMTCPITKESILIWPLSRGTSDHMVLLCHTECDILKLKWKSFKPKNF